MLRSNRPHTRKTRLPVLLAAVAVLLCVPSDRALRTRAYAQAHQPSEGKPDPCVQIVSVPGKANGLHKECAELGGGSGVARADFNGDGIGDLAIGVPYENVDGANNAGAVSVLYGSVSGLTATGNQFFTQNSDGVPGGSETDDHFGQSVAAVDLNNDGYSDLAVGVPNEDGIEGLVQIFMGSRTGLTPGATLTHQSMTGTTCTCLFGSALAWGDFDDDNKGDLAIGMRAYEVQHVDQGAVIIRFGAGDYQEIKYPGYANMGNSNASFGMVLAAGDYNGDGADDLAIGAPLQDVLQVNNVCGLCVTVNYAGAVYLYTGASTGLRASRVFTDMFGVEDSDQFGRALAFGDFDNNGRDDLAVGTPNEDFDGHNDAGAVSIFHYNKESLDEVIRQGRTSSNGGESAGIPGDAEAGDLVGRALAAGDFNGDGYDDLAIGAPGEDLGNPYSILTFFQSAGAVIVMNGTGGRFNVFLSKIWHQDVDGVPGAAETGDMFGYSLSAWNFGNGSAKDLAIGIPFEDVGDKEDAGAIVVLYSGGSGGLKTDNAQLWTQDSPGIIDTASTADRWGNAMY